MIREILVNDQKLIWSVPDWIGEGAFRIRDVRDSGVSSVSPLVKIQGDLQLLSPQGSEVFYVGDALEVRWSSTGTIPVVRLEYSKDLFETDIHLIEPNLEVSKMQSETAGEFVYRWTIPDDIAEQVHIRVADARNPAVSSLMRASFQIQPRFEMLSPKGREVWQVGSEQEIHWRTWGTVPHVRIELSKDAFKNDVQIVAASTANNGRFLWTVADAIAPEVWLRVVDPRYEEAFAVQKMPSVIKGALKFQGFQQNQVVQVGDEILFRWETTGTIPNVALEYFSEANPHEVIMIEARAPNQGTYYWRVPDVILNDVKIRISDSRDFNGSRCFRSLDEN